MKHSIILCLTAMLTFASCSTSPRWTIDGRIEGADGMTMLIEQSSNGRWFPIDSVTLDAAGNFSVSHAAPEFPEIYRLRLDDKTLYFPIDSIETVTVRTNASSFDVDYTLSGSSEAERLMAADRCLLSVVERSGASGAVNDSLLKRTLGGMLLEDPSGIVSYYIISKSIGGIKLFDPSRPTDLKIIGAVANAYDRFRPADPRTTYLRNLYLHNRNVSDAAPRDTVAATVTSLFDISLYDNRGTRQSLAELAASRKVIVLNFTVYQAEESPAFNRLLNRVYEKYRSQGLEIFQVAFDDDEPSWRQAAEPLPWITVYNSPAAGPAALRNYNVGSFPTTFVINREGDIVARITDINELDSTIARHL